VGRGAKKASGPLLLEVYQRMLAAQNSEVSSAKKLYVLSGHDVGPMIPLLSAFGFIEHWPPYASYISLEMYKKVDCDEYFIRPIYNGEVFKISGIEPDSDGLYTFSQFQSVIQPMLPTEADCPVLFP
jgi:hypothetical protein